MKLSKWPFRIRSPIGEGARRGLPDSVTVADRFGFLPANEEVGMTGEVDTAVLGGGAGWGGLVEGAAGFFALPKDRRLKIFTPRSCCTTSATAGFCANTPLMLERRV